MAQITLDTLNPQDINDVMSALQSIAIRNNLERIYCPIQEYNRVNEELNNQILKNKQQEDEIEKTKGNLEKETKERESLASQLSELQSQYSDLSQKFNSQSEELRNCYEKLDGYTIDYKPTGTQSAFIYFDVDNGKLIETTQKSAFYKAIWKGNVLEFVYNEERAFHMKAINGQDTILAPFCEIEGQIAEYPNYVESRGKGILSLENDILTVKKTARVRIIRK